MTRALSIAGIALLSTLALAGCGWSGPDPDSGPEQPIAFYHSVHAGQNGIPCAYCHYTADRSPSAGVPSVKLCVGCHVPGSAESPPENAQLAFPGRDRPAQGDTVWFAEASKLVEYWREQEAIPWVKVYNLPEHVRFTHSAHVRVGLECQTCHGPVEEMERVYQYSSLQMGWCVDCHRGEAILSAEEEASVRERSTYINKLRQIEAAGGDVAGSQVGYPNQRASTDCFVCHY